MVHLLLSSWDFERFLSFFLFFSLEHRGSRILVPKIPTLYMIHHLDTSRSTEFYKISAVFWVSFLSFGNSKMVVCLIQPFKWF